MTTATTPRPPLVPPRGRRRLPRSPAARATTALVLTLGLLLAFVATSDLADGAERERLAVATTVDVPGSAQSEAVVVPLPTAPAPEAEPGQRGDASYYHSSLAGRPTASGEAHDPGELVAAHRSLPFGTLVEVENLENGKTVRVRVNDRGPFAHRRIVDLSRSAAKQLGILQSGTAPVEVRVVE